MAITGVTNAHGPPPQTTTRRSPSGIRKEPGLRQGLYLLCLRGLGLIWEQNIWCQLVLEEDEQEVVSLNPGIEY